MGSWWCWAVGATNTIRVVTRPSPQSAKPEAEPQGDSREQLPILADMILYYCRFATRPVLLQLYQTEVSKGAQHGGRCLLPGSPTWGPPGERMWVWHSHLVLVSPKDLLIFCRKEQEGQVAPPSSMSL